MYSLYYSEPRKRGFRRFNAWLTVPTRSISTLFCYTEKLDINHNTPFRQKRLTMAPTGYKELTEKQKRAVLGALISHVVDGKLQHGSYALVGKKLGVPAKSAARLWRASSTTRATGVIQSPEVVSKKKGNDAYRKPKLVYDREMMKEEILTIPLWKRSTVRNLAAELKMPRSTVQDILKKEKDEVIHHHTSRLKGSRCSRESSTASV